MGSRNPRGQNTIVPTEGFLRRFGGGEMGLGEVAGGSGQGSSKARCWARDAGMKVNTAVFQGGDGWLRVRLDPILRSAARWANGKVWAAVRRGGEVGKLAARFAPIRWCASRPLPS